MMKRFVTYALGLLLLAACSKEETLTPDRPGETGRLRMNIAATRTEGEGYDPMDRLTVRVYNAEGGLLRKYASREALPETLELLAGSYHVAVEAGEAVAASHEKRRYEGAQEFEITAGRETTAEVLCTLQNTVVEVSFDERIAAEFDPGFLAWVAVGEEVAGVQEEDENVPELRFTADGWGYFTLPEGAGTLSWRFRGEHPEKGSVDKSGTMPLKSDGGSYRYKLTFRFSEDLPGYVEGVVVTIDEPATGEDDTIIFSPDPVIESVDFDIDALQQYVSGTRSYRIATMAPLAGVKVSFDGTDYTVFGAGAAEVPGVALAQQSDTELTLTLSEEFFAGRAGGDHTVAVAVADSDGGALARRTPYRLQGILPVEAKDYNLWSNTVTLRALVFDPAAEVRFFLRRAGGEWNEAAGEAAADGGFTARFAARWVESTNDAGLTVYTPAAGTGVFAAGSYECAVEIGGARSETAFESGAGNEPIYNAGMELWSTYKVVGSTFTSGEVPYPNENSSKIFWAGGNNKQTASLCTGVGEAGCNGSRCAQLMPAIAAGSTFAAGNLFTGIFEGGSSMSDMSSGYARFGASYPFTARPRALNVHYKAIVSAVTHEGDTGLSKSDIDCARIYVCIVDWKERHSVKSGLSFDASTFWDPATAASLPEGAILGYGARTITASTDGWVADEPLEICWYDREAPIPAGTYTLVISCVTSYKGDYMGGSTNNRLYVEDFEWVY